ncbi:MAG TPA: cardiolipin synthase [Usitatibacter sp.]|nr:cardiolipin synthase [Usitatibacter sp.]
MLQIASIEALEIPWFAIFAISYVIWVLLACASLLMSRRSPQATLAWIFAFIALPVVSGIYYMLFGPRRLLRRKRRYGVARAQAGAVSQHLRSTCCDLKPPLPPDARGLAAVGKRLGQGEATYATSIELLDDGDQKMQALEEALVGARHHVHIEYYIWEPDRVGVHFRDLLATAAGRGVEVRVLYDAVGSPRLNNAFWKPVTDAGGEVRAFNALRFSITSLHFANFRTHRKIVVVDGVIGFLGGMNMHDPATATRSGKDAWRDQHATIVGEPVRKMQRLFLENWTYSGGSFRLSNQSMPFYFPSAKEGGRGVAVQILASGPDEENAALHAFFLAAIATARDRIWIETPYLIPDEALESALRVAELRGVDVQVIVPKQGDSRLVTMASHTYCDSLAKAGIRVFQYGPPMLHAKTMLIDETVGVVGTANLDNRSFRLNFEIAAAFYDRSVVARLAKRFEADREVSQPFSHRRRGPRITQMLESIARLTSPVL